MECLHPYPVRLPSGEWIEVRCRHCLPCLGHRQAEWITRLSQEFKASPDGVYFVTLTYDDEHLPKKHVGPDRDLPSIRSADIIKFNRDLRKRFQQGFYNDRVLLDSGWSFSPTRIELPKCQYKYYITSEYGPLTHRPHYHGFFSRLPEDEDLVFDLFNAMWGKGFITCEKGKSEACANYVSKYLINDSLVPVDLRVDRPRAWMSKGLGEMYLDNEKMLDWHRSAPLDRLFVPSRNGDKGVMPRYYRDKILDDDMKAGLQDFAVRRAEVRQASIDRMSIDEFVKYRNDLKHREDENLRQAEWRFRKNGKIK